MKFVYTVEQCTGDDPRLDEHQQTSVGHFKKSWVIFINGKPQWTYGTKNDALDFVDRLVARDPLNREVQR
jgi:hypothetical protein